MWGVVLIRTLLGVGVVRVTNTGIVWLELYFATMAAVLFWPTYIAVPLRRLHDLRRGWRTLATAYGTLSFGIIVMLLTASYELDVPLGYFTPASLSGPFVVIDPAAAPATTIMLLMFVVPVCCFAAYLFFAPSKEPAADEVPEAS